MKIKILRFIGIFLDIFIYIVPIEIVLFITDKVIYSLSGDEKSCLISSPLFSVISAIVIIAFLFKDISGRSIGKKILHLNIFNTADKSIPVSKWKLVARNLTFSFWIIEAAVVILSSSSTRISDRLLGLSVELSS